MKYLITSLFLTTLISCISDNKKILQSDLAEFSNLKIEFITGDDRITRYVMEIYKDSQKIVALKKRPLYYYGTNSDSVWATEISQSDLEFIKTFLSIAKKQKDSCALYSTSIDHYSIEIGGKEKINIVGNCEWNGFDYDSLEQRLFYSKFKELENKRTLLTDSIAKSFIGTWEVSGWENGTLINKNVHLTRFVENIPKTSKKTYWTVQKPTELKKNIYVINGTYIEIRGSNYEIIKIETNNIDLKYRW